MQFGSIYSEEDMFLLSKGTTVNQILEFGKLFKFEKSQRSGLLKELLPFLE
jgi:hypothetical protein